MARTVMAHTKDGRAFVGVLVGSYHDAFVLRHARAMPLDEVVVGDLVIPRDNLGWFQADVPDHLLKLNAEGA